MPYDERLAERVRDVLAPHDEVTERRMFGGLAFMVAGKMCCGVIGDTLMVRVGPAYHEAALRRRHVRVMDFTGRPSTGMVYVDPPGLATRRQLAGWVERGVAGALAAKG
jgi:TfoX/Sxy family transcriptional regulator of competence genes